MPDVIIRYESGFPTRLKNHNRLAALIERDGPPMRIEGDMLVWFRSCGRFAAQWDYRLSGYPFFPGDTRKMVSVELEDCND